MRPEFSCTRTMRISLLIPIALLIFLASAAQAQDPPVVRVYTNKGSFVIALDVDRAPLTVANFLEYVRAGHYNGTVFHRVIGNFVAQGGGYDTQYIEKPTRAGVP